MSDMKLICAVIVPSFLLLVAGMVVSVSTDNGYYLVMGLSASIVWLCAGRLLAR